MKNIFKIVILGSLLILFASCASGVYKKSSLKKMHQQVEQKVDQMQKMIKFSDAQSFRLKKVELKYLKELHKIEDCKDCNKEYLLQKLQNKKDVQLQNILERHQYIQYSAIEEDRIKPIDLIAK